MTYKDAMLRSFIAIEIPPLIQAGIFRETCKLRERFGKPLVRWVPTNNVHLTLKFLGDMTEANLDKLAQHLTTEMNGFSSFDISVGGIGAFPNASRPRVIWIGVEAPGELTRVSHRIDSVSSRLGIPSETRPFSPHLTFGRVNQQNFKGVEMQLLGTELKLLNIGLLGIVPVHGIHIYTSDLQPTGAVYTHLKTIPLSPS